jgi:prepilin-type N-terminal cleavage/methylation domain-containing protein
VRLGDRTGFSLVEMMVALVILTVGVLLLAGGSVFVTRDLLRSRQATLAVALAQARLDDLRARAASTSPPCLSGEFASSAAPALVDGVTLSWTVEQAGNLRWIRVVASYPLGAGRVRADTLLGSVGC